MLFLTGKSIPVHINMPPSKIARSDCQPHVWLTFRKTFNCAMQV